MSTAPVAADAAEVGQPLPEDVVVEVDYAIIRHFSEHLYGSPNKAVEELVSNSYDALARQCRVYLPGRFTTDRVIVWDNGGSMGVKDLKALWVIARSPKESGTARSAEADGLRRLMIGKFGIGKLASYALGERITHYCRVGDDFLAVTVDYRVVHADLEPQTPHGNAPMPPPSNRTARYATPIRRLTEDEARQHLRSLFDAEPEAMGSLFGCRSWTVAVVDRLKDVELSQGRLKWVLGNGMPLRPDFRLFVNDDEVQSRLGAGATSTWTLGESAVQEALRTAWTSSAGATDRTAVSGHYLLPGSPWPAAQPPVEHSDTVPDDAVVFPELGPVTAEVRLFGRSLQRRDDSEQPRSHGFFVMVRGRLVNPEDDRLLLADPSFSTFYRAQFVIHADGLDQDLLADRERIREDTPRGRELAILQQALYRAARAELERQDVDAAAAATTESLLPVDSRELFREPLTALLLRDESGPAAFPLNRPTVRRAELDEAAPVSDLDPGGAGFRVNSAHPFYRSIKAKAGTGKKAAEFLRVFDLFAVSERLLEGHLYDIGLGETEVRAVMDWRDQLFRALAGRHAAASADAVQRVREASFKGDKELENALAALFSLMGFVAVRDGASGKKDVLVVAPVGPDAQRFTIEAKGSRHPVGNDDTDLDIAAAHRTDTGATHSIVVAREFKGFAREGGDRPHGV